MTSSQDPSIQEPADNQAEVLDDEIAEQEKPEAPEQDKGKRGKGRLAIN